MEETNRAVIIVCIMLIIKIEAQISSTSNNAVERKKKKTIC